MREASVRVRWHRHRPTVPSAAYPSATVLKTLSSADNALDYGHAKLAFTDIINPALAIADRSAQLDRMADGVRRLAGPGSDTIK